MNDSETIYPCVGICTTDPDSDHCLGCGRPPEASMKPKVDAIVTVEITGNGAAKPPSVASLDTPD